MSALMTASPGSTSVTTRGRMLARARSGHGSARGCGPGCRRLVPLAGVSQAELAGRQAVGITERTVEVRGADEAPAGRHGGYRPGREGRVEQVTAGSIQP